MQRLGFVAADNNIRNALLLSMLCQRQVDPEKLELETLKRVITYGPVYMRRSAATLSRIFAAMGLFPAGIDHRILERRRPHGNIVQPVTFRKNGCDGVNAGVKPLLKHHHLNSVHGTASCSVGAG